MVVTGVDVKMTFPDWSVTVYETSACCCLLTALRISAETSTWPPGCVNVGLGVTDATCTSAAREINEPVVDWVSSVAPSTVAVTWKLNGERFVVEEFVSVTVTCGTPNVPTVSWPG